MRWRTHRVFCALLLVSSIVAAQDPSSPCEGWKAWVTHPASASAILHVTAECQLPTPGHKVELVRDSKQGSDPTVFVVNEVVHPPEGMVAQVITPYKLHYRKKIQKTYKEVLIQPSGAHVTIEERSKQSSETPPAK
jgi:hypothetical protein